MGKPTQAESKRRAKQMSLTVDLSKLVPCAEIRGDSPTDTELLSAMSRDAEEFLLSFEWCHRISRCFFGFGIGGVVAVFLFQIDPAKKNVDEWLWVVTGDLPPAYLVVDESPTPLSALETYVSEMRRWIRAVRDTGSFDDVIPVNVAPTIENANDLQRRLDFVAKELVAFGK